MKKKLISFGLAMLWTFAIFFAVSPVKQAFAEGPGGSWHCSGTICMYEDGSWWKTRYIAEIHEYFCCFDRCSEWFVGSQLTWVPDPT